VLTVLLAVAVDCGNDSGQPFEHDEADSVRSYVLVDYSIGGTPRPRVPKGRQGPPGPRD